MLTFLHAYLQSRFDFVDEKGAVAAEYGLLLALIALAIIAGATLLGGNLDGLFRNVANRLPQPAA